MIGTTAATTLCLGCDEPRTFVDSAGTSVSSDTTQRIGSTEVFELAGEDASWSGTIAQSGIVFRRGASDTLVFDFRPPTVTGAISDYESLLLGRDTIRLSISLAFTKCSARGREYTHMAQVYLTGKQRGRTLNAQFGGCAAKQ